MIVEELLIAAEQALIAALECQELPTRRRLVAAANDCIDLLEQGAVGSAKQKSGP